MVEEPKPQHSYIGLIAMAILSSADKKLVLSDIYQYILDNYAYFRSRGPGWRNSIRHNLSLNDCFIKAGRSANGKGHYWAIHPANVEDFTKGDFRRRKAQRKVRKHMGLAVDEEDSPTPPPSPVTAHHVAASLAAGWTLGHHHHHHHGEMAGGLHPQHRNLMMEHHHSVLMMAAAAAASAAPIQHMTSLSPSASSDDGQQLSLHHQTHPSVVGASSAIAPRKRLFDVASLLGRSDPQPANTPLEAAEQQRQRQQDDEDERSSGAGSSQSRREDGNDRKRIKMELDEDVDVVSEDSEEDDHLRRLGSTSPQQTQPEDGPAKSVASSLGIISGSVSPAAVSSSPIAVAAAAAAAAGLWRFHQPASTVAVAPRLPLPPHRLINNNGHHLNQQQAYFQQQQQQLNHSPSGMEQLTKYYEQVAEVMRINCLQQQQQQQRDPANGKTAKHSV